MKISVVVICVEAIIYLSLRNLHDCALKGVTKLNFIYGHYFIQYGLMQVCIFNLFLWKLVFCLSTQFVFCACSEF